MLVDGDVRMAWVTLMHAFGTVEVIERAPYFDGKVKSRPAWVGVCVDPFHKAYRGSLVVVREWNATTVFVVGSDNDGVLFGDLSPLVERDIEGLTVLFPDSQLQEPELPVDKRPARAWSCRVHSGRFGMAIVDVSVAGNIVNASGQFGVFVGMEFYAFLRGLKQNDSTVKYRRLDRGDV